MIESILTHKKENINLSNTLHLDQIICLKKIENHNFIKRLILNNFEITKKEHCFFIKRSSKHNIQQFMNVVNEITKNNKYHFILLQYRNEIENFLNENKIYYTSSIQSLISIVFLDLIIILELAAYKHNNNIDYKVERKLINKITGIKNIFSVKRNKENSYTYKRTPIAIRSKNSIFYSKEDNHKKIHSKIKKECENIGLIELELPIKHNKIKTIEILSIFNQILNEIKLKNRDFIIRFKKINHYKKTGLYIKNAETIIVDPRNVSTLYHEIGHFIFETKSEIILDDKIINISKIIKENKDKYQFKIKNHKIENINEDSEIFAYYFEEKMNNKIKNLNNISLL